MLELGLKAKTAIITGGSDGLGRATATRFASEGVNTVICGRREDYLKDVASQIESETGGTVLAVRADVSIADDCTNLVAEAAKAFGGIDILINNAGTSAAAGFEDVSDDDWQVDVDLKIMGAVRMIRGVLPFMKKAGGGSIINATIGAGKAPPAERLPTSVSRAAGINLTKSLANEFAKDNIRVNAICIGLIKSAQWERRAADGSLEDFYANMARNVPLGRMGEASDYGDLAAFLCSSAGSYITGTAVNLDGGLCMTV